MNMKKITAFLLSALLSVTTPILLATHPMPSVSAKGIGTADAPVCLTAHRGVKARAPENSIPAFQMAVDMGYYSAETDIHLTKDNVWVICHNDNIKKYYTGNAEIKDSTYEQLHKHIMRGGNGLISATLRYGLLRIPTLEEYLDVFVGQKTRPQIEIKTEDGDLRGLDQVLDLLAEKGLTRQAIVIAFDPLKLHYLREKDPDLELWLLCGKITPAEIAEAKSIGGNTWLSCCWEENSIETLQNSVNDGVPVSMWTVDRIEDAKALYNAGFRYIETDRLSQ